MEGSVGPSHRILFFSIGSESKRFKALFAALRGGSHFKCIFRITRIFKFLSVLKFDIIDMVAVPLNSMTIMTGETPVRKKGYFLCPLKRIREERVSDFGDADYGKFVGASWRGAAFALKQKRHPVNGVSRRPPLWETIHG